MKFLFNIFLILIPFIFTQCMGIYGLKSLKTLNNSEIIKTAEKYKIKSSELVLLDTAYKSYLISLPEFDSLCAKDTLKRYQCYIQKNHLQPLQILFFDKSSKFVSYNVNCNIPGFPNLKWNYFGYFNEFPPKSATYCDSIFNFHKFSKYIKLPDNTQLNLGSVTNYNYLVIVFWCRFGGRQSKRLIKFVYSYLEQYNTKSYKVLFLNVDNFAAVSYQ
jgi:hypothetical protein